MRGRFFNTPSLFARRLGFTEFTEEERRAFTPVRQRLVCVHPATGRKSLYLSSHIGSTIRIATSPTIHARQTKG